ncbi:MAG: YncE family protein, partial [Pseudomonadota bacterium]
MLRHTGEVRGECRRERPRYPQVRRVNRLTAIAFVAAFAASESALAGPNAYVPNEGSATISVIDTATDRVSATLKIGAKPRGIAVAADGARLFVSDQKANAVIVHDLAKGTELARLAVGDSPEAIY